MPMAGCHKSRGNYIVIDKEVWRRFLDLMKEENKRVMESLGIEYNPNCFYDTDRDLDSENWDKNWRKVE